MPTARDSTSTAAPRPLSRKILLGVAAGIAAGLFFGDRTAVMEPLADAYIKLLQMTVLPYVTLSIIAGLGALTPAQARLLGSKVGLVILALWLVTICAVWLFPVMFPTRESATFFSSALVEEREPFNFLDLYIPANPFNSLANNIVPAVVLFSIVVGCALITVPGKARLLDVLAIASAAVARVTMLVVNLSPYGMFAVSAVMAGTIGLDQLLYLEVYLVTYVAMALLLSLWILPGLVATLTPVPYRALMSRTRDALLLAFMTTSLFAVLPLLTEQIKSLIREFLPADGNAESSTDVIVPTSFNFPHAGKILSLSFILFAGWFMDAVVPLSEYPRLAGSGILAMFGSANAAIPFLLDQLRLPADAFRLFVASGMVNARFGTLVAAMHTVAVAAIGACALSESVRFETNKLTRFVAMTVVITGVVVGGTRLVLQAALDRPYSMDTRLTSKQSFFDRHGPRPDTRSELLLPLKGEGGSVVERVRERKSLRIGYFDDSLPYAFLNREGQLVGFDVDMARELAADLQVTPEFVRLDRGALQDGLDPASCDIVMSGVALSADRALRLQYSASYLDETVAFIVPDHRGREFSDWESVRAMGRLRIGAPGAPYYLRQVRAQLRDAEIVPFDRVDAMFAPRDPPLDAVVLTAERGSAYTLIHPAYSVVVPRPGSFKVPLAYVIAGRDAGLTSVVNIWIEQKRKDGTIDQLFGYWILGQEREAPPRRWSVVDNVLRRAQ